MAPLITNRKHNRIKKSANIALCIHKFKKFRSKALILTEKNIVKNSSIVTTIMSSDKQYLANIQSLSKNKLGIASTLSVATTYKTQKGKKTKYRVRIYSSLRNPNNLPFFQNLVKDNVMTLDRKKQKVQQFVNCVS